MSNNERSHESRQETRDTSKDRKKGSKALRAWLIGGAVAVVGVVGVSTAVINMNKEAVTPDVTQGQDRQLTQDEIIERNSQRQKEEDAKVIADYDKKIESQAYIDSLKMPSGLKGASFRESLTGSFNAWISAGADEKLLNAQLRTEPGLGEDGVASNIALKNQNAYATALFGEGWAEDKYLSAYAGHLTDLNARFLGSYYDSLDNENGVRYKAQMESTDEGDGDGLLLPGRTRGSFSRINYIYTDNSADSGVSAGFPEKNETLITFDYINNSTVVTYANYLTNIR